MTAADLLPIAVKGALVLAVAFLALRLLRDVPAALRHGIWTAAFAALLVLPALDAFGPSWGLPILPDQARVSEATTYVLGERALSPPPVPEPAVRSRRTTTRTLIRTGPVAPPVGPTRSVTVISDGPHSRAPALPLGSLLLGVWGLGVAALLLRWAAAYISAAAVVRAATPVTDDEWLDLAERARRLVGVRGDVRLVRSHALTVPVAWGLGTPAVVLPADADSWDEGRREAVLLHEMAHLRRADARTQIVAQLAVALHWPNPLAWLAYRRFLTEREHACDDAVLSGGAAPSDYAGHLVEIARRARRQEPLALSAVSPMARRSDLEGRVLCVLDAGRRRVAAGRSPLVRTVALGLLVAAPLSTVRAVTSAPSRTVTLDDRRAPTPDTPPTPDAIRVAVAEARMPTVEAAVTAAVADALLDTIPRAETILGPALDAALADVRRMRADGLGVEGATWDEIEDSVRDAFQSAHRDYDDAVAMALAEADAERREGDAEWRADLQEALADAEADRQDAIEEMAEAAAERSLGWGQGGDARRAADRRTRAAQEAFRAAEHAQRDREHALRDANRTRQIALAEGQRARDIALRDADRTRQRAQRNADRARQRGLETAQRERERAQRSADRSRHTSSSSSSSSSHSSGYAYSVGADGRSVAVTTSPGVGAWMSRLDALDHAADGISQAIAEIEARGTARPGVLAGLRGGLAGLEGGLTGVAASAQGWARSDAEREIARTRVDVTRRRIRDAKKRLDACIDAEACD